MGSSTGQLNNGQVKFGNNAYRGAAANACARGVSHADYNFGTNDWCVEFWVWLDSLTPTNNGVNVLFDMRNSSLSTQWVPSFFTDGTGAIALSMNGSNRVLSSTGVMSATTWLHIAGARVSGTTRLFVQGAQVGSDFTDANTYVQNQITLGAAGNNGGSVKGYFDDIRITNGAGRYSSSFSVPTAPFPNQ